MNNSNGVSSYLAGPGGRFDLANPSTQAMVKDVMGNPGAAPKYGVSLPEIFQLHQLLKQISAQTPQPQQTTVADDLKMAALASIQAPNAAPPQGAQPLQGIQQAMPQARMPQNPMEQGVAGLDTGMMENAEYAGGGIVAFAGEDEQLVPGEEGTAPKGVSPFSGTSKELYEQILANQRAQQAAFRVPTLQEAMEEERVAREAAGIKGKLGEERLKKLEGAGKKDAEREKKIAGGALTDAFFRMAVAGGRKGATFLGAAAEGASAGFANYVSAQKELEKLQAERDKEIANIQNLQRAEDLGFVKNASGKIEKAQGHLADIERNISTTQASIAGQMSAAERSQAEATSREGVARLDRGARAEEAAANRGVQLQIAKLHAAGQPLDVQKIMEMPQFNAAHGNKDPETRLKIATELLAGRRASPEKTQTALINATRDAAKEWGKLTGIGGRLSQIAKRAENADPKISGPAKAQLEAARQRHYAGFDLEAPSLSDEAKYISGAPQAATPTTGAGQFNVSAPNGKVYSFQTQEAADQFAKSIGK